MNEWGKVVGGERKQKCDWRRASRGVDPKRQRRWIWEIKRDWVKTTFFLMCPFFRVWISALVIFPWFFMIPDVTEDWLKHGCIALNHVRAQIMCESQPCHLITRRQKIKGRLVSSLLGRVKHYLDIWEGGRYLFPGCKLQSSHAGRLDRDWVLQK